jgi:hypothetical protein
VYPSTLLLLLLAALHMNAAARPAQLHLHNTTDLHHKTHFFCVSYTPALFTRACSRGWSACTAAAQPPYIS